MKPSLPALLAVLAAVALSGCQKQDDAQFGARVRTYLLAHPEVLVEVSAKLQARQQADAEASAKAAVAKASLLIPRYRNQIERDPRDVVANPGGRVTVTEFFDYRCGYCKASAPEVLKLIDENPDVRFVFKQTPIFGGVSDLAAQTMLTDAGRAKGVALFRAIMTDRDPLDESGLDRHLAAVGIDPKAAKAAAAAPAIQKQIDDTHVLFKALGADGTPTFVVGDKLIIGARMDDLRAAVTAAKATNLKTAG
jgi:protein-disulfide isomerase